MFSRRSAVPRDPNAIARAWAALKAAGKPSIDLTVSNPTRVGLSYPVDELLAALGTPAALDYAPEPLGLLAARQAVGKHFAERGHPVDSARVLLTASTSEAYSLLFKLLCDPGDEVLVPQPSYPLFEHLARFDAQRAVPYPLRYDGAWHVDLPELAAGVSERTRAILVVSPNNPTGSYLSREELGEIAKLKIPIVSDEVFSDYPLLDDPRRANTALLAEDTLVFALGGLSKLATLPGLKLAWAAASGPDPIVNEAMGRMELIADAYLSPSTAVQLALPRILELTAGVRCELRARLGANLSSLRSALEGSAANVLRVEGGWYAVVRLPELADEEAWVLSLLERDGVLVEPGFFYDFAFGPVVVVSLIVPPDTLERGVARLATRVDRGP